MNRRAAPRPRTILVVVALALTGILAAVLVCVFWREPHESQEPRVHIGIGSKPFTESVILGDMVQHLVERAGDTTEHRQLGGTQIVAEHRRQLVGTRVVWEAMVGGKERRDCEI